MFKQVMFIITCLLFAVNSMAQHTYGSFYTHDAFINYILSENRTENATIVMVPGANLSTYIYVTTPDGRKGWAELFADKGYDVYMVNDPRYDFATGGFVEPYTVPADGKEATPGSEQGWQSDIWRRWGFGHSQGNPYADALFPTEYFDVFAKNYPYIGTSKEDYSDAIQAVLDSIKSEVWLIAHSAGASRAVTAARQKKEQVNGLILIEPAGPPDADDFPDLDGLHMFGVYGDYIDSRNQTNRKLATEAAAVQFQNAGGVADVVSLPEDSLVFGNSHLLMQDRNSEDIFNIIEHWLRQFSTNTVSIESKFDNNISINLYPNPTGNEIWIESNSMDVIEYCIYSMDGRLLQESTVLNQKIDLSGAPNGLLFVKLKHKEQVIMKKIIKNGL
ncbi:MAG: T9SS type A sorting domain-containing protein [Candidatus Kapabacteria bacterium]|nr:T9SS type A sorting domain-containing protein [Candidatus Kapabacteria bacterium]